MSINREGCAFVEYIMTGLISTDKYVFKNIVQQFHKSGYGCSEMFIMKRNYVSKFFLAAWEADLTAINDLSETQQTFSKDI